MSSRNFHSKCAACSRIFSKESSKTDYCCECDANLKTQEQCSPNKTCKSCFRPFYTPNSCILCPICTTKGYNEKSRPPRHYDNSKPTKIRHGRPVPIEVLDRRTEYKRVMDDKSWSHYLKGRKWDRI